MQCVVRGGSSFEVLDRVSAGGWRDETMGHAHRVGWRHGTGGF